MSSEDFKITREINSLTLKRSTLLDEVTTERKRITFIESNREDRNEELVKTFESLKETKSLMQQVENSIANHQAQLSKDQDHLSAVTSNEQLKSLESSIKHCEEKIEEFENQGLELLDKIESYEEIVSNCESFLKGSAETLTEINLEVEAYAKSHQVEIDRLDSRISLLMKSLPPAFSDRIKRVFERNIAISSFTRIVGDSCEFCKFTLNKADIINVEDKLQLKGCQSCGRIFIPQQASY